MLCAGLGSFPDPLESSNHKVATRQYASQSSALAEIFNSFVRRLVGIVAVDKSTDEQITNEPGQHPR